MLINQKVYLIPGNQYRLSANVQVDRGNFASITYPRVDGDSNSTIELITRDDEFAVVFTASDPVGEDREFADQTDSQYISTIILEGEGVIFSNVMLHDVSVIDNIEDLVTMENSPVFNLDNIGDFSQAPIGFINSGITESTALVDNNWDSDYMYSINSVVRYGFSNPSTGEWDVSYYISKTNSNSTPPVDFTNIPTVTVSSNWTKLLNIKPIFSVTYIDGDSNNIETHGNPVLTSNDYTWTGREDINIQGARRNNYTDAEVVDFLKDRLNDSLSFGDSVDGKLFKWLDGEKASKIDLGLSETDNVVISTFTSGNVNKIRRYGNVTMKPMDTLTYNKQRMYTRWGIGSNLHSDKVISKSNNKLAVLPDYPLRYNSGLMYNGGITPTTINNTVAGSGGDINNIQFTINKNGTSITTVPLKIFDSTNLYKKYTNGNHNNITLDMGFAKNQFTVEKTSELIIAGNQLNKYTRGESIQITTDDNTFISVVIGGVSYDGENTTLYVDKKINSKGTIVNGSTGRHHISINSDLHSVDTSFQTSVEFIKNMDDLVGAGYLRSVRTGTSKQYYYKPSTDLVVDNVIDVDSNTIEIKNKLDDSISYRYKITTAPKDDLSKFIEDHSYLIPSKISYIDRLDELLYLTSVNYSLSGYEDGVLTSFTDASILLDTIIDTITDADISTGSNTFTVSSSPVNNSAIKFTSTNGFTLNYKAVDSDAVYYVNNRTATTFQISESIGGDIIEITSSGIGNVLIKTSQLSGITYNTNTPSIGDRIEFKTVNGLSINNTAVNVGDGFYVGSVNGSFVRLVGYIGGDVLDITSTGSGDFSIMTMGDMKSVPFYNDGNGSVTRHKKTFIHLPTEGVKDGQECSITVTLPVEDGTSSLNPIHESISRKSYTSQPRVYVLSGSGSDDCISSSYNYPERFESINTSYWDDLVNMDSVNNEYTGDSIYNKYDNVYPSGILPISLARSSSIYGNWKHVTGIKFSIDLKNTTSIFSDIDTMASNGESVVSNMQLGDINTKIYTIISMIPSFTYTSISGKLSVGDIVTGSTSGATGKVIRLSPYKLLIDPLTGTFVSETITSGSIEYSIRSVVEHVRVKFISRINDVTSTDYIVYDMNTYDVVSGYREFDFVYTSEFNTLVGTGSLHKLYVNDSSTPSVTYETTTGAVNGGSVKLLFSNGTIQNNDLSDFLTYKQELKCYKAISSSPFNGQRGGDTSLTERRNNYIYSNSPDVESYNEKSILHQYPMTLNDIDFGDKRVLLASVYPTASSTFGLKTNKNTNARLLYWSILGANAFDGGPMRSAFDAIKDIFDTSGALNSLPITKFPISLSGQNYTGASKMPRKNWAMNVAEYIRPLLPPSLKPTEDDIKNHEFFNGAFSDITSYTMQGAVAWKLLIDFLLGSRFHKGTTGSKLTADSLIPGSVFSDYGIIMNITNGTTGTVVDSFNEYLTHISTSTDDMDIFTNSTDAKNISEWMTYPLYIPSELKSQDNGLLSLHSSSIHSIYTNGSSIDLLENYNSYGDIDYTMYVNKDSFIVEGSGSSDVKDPDISNYGKFGVFDMLLDINNNSGSIVNTALRNGLWRQSFPVSLYTTGSHSTSNGGDSTYFHSLDHIFSSFMNVFALDNIKMPTGSSFIGTGSLYMTPDDNTSAIKTTSPLYKTVMDTIAQYPLLERFYETEKSYISITTDVSGVDIDTKKESYLKSYISPFANQLPLRLYNSFKTVVAGQLTAVDTPMSRKIWDITIGDYTDWIGVDSDVQGDTSYIIDDRLMYVSDSRSELLAVNPNISFVDASTDSTGDNDQLIYDVGNSKPPIQVSTILFNSKQESIYIRVDMKFIYSEELDRWVTLDYRQSPSTYLVPSFGAKSINAKVGTYKKSGEVGDKPSDFSSDTDYLWIPNGDYTVNDIERSKIERDAWATTPYYLMRPLELNKYSIPTMANIKISGDIISDDHSSIDDKETGYKDFRIWGFDDFSRFGFGVPSDVNGSVRASNLTNPLPWKVYWNIRPCVTANVISDVPSKTGRVGGSPGNPTLGNLYQYPNTDSLEYRIPWDNDHKIDWLTASDNLLFGTGYTSTIFDAGSGSDDRSSYIWIDANPDGIIFINSTETMDGDIISIDGTEYIAGVDFVVNTDSVITATNIVSVINVSGLTANNIDVVGSSDSGKTNAIRLVIDSGNTDTHTIAYIQSDDTDEPCVTIHNNTFRLYGTVGDRYDNMIVLSADSNNIARLEGGDIHVDGI